MTAATLLAATSFAPTDKAEFNLSSICSPQGRALMTSYVAEHWGHLSAFPFREASDCADLIQFRRQASCATSVHLQGWTHTTGGFAGSADAGVNNDE